MSEDEFELDPFAALDDIEEEKEPEPTPNIDITKKEDSHIPDITQAKQREPRITQTKHSNKFIKNFLIDLALSSEFERVIFKSILGKVVRGSNENLEYALNNILKCLHDFFSQYSQKELANTEMIDLIIKDLNQKLQSIVGPD